MAERVNLGPLTTVFTPPVACTAGLLDFSANNQVNSVLWGGVCSMVSGFAYPVVDESCYPSGIFSGPTTGAGFVPIFSPGLSCPYGFYSACTSTKQASDPVPDNGAFLWSALSAGETVIGCCPSGYTCGTSSDAGIICQSSATLGEVVTGTSYDSSCRTTTASGTVVPASDFGLAFRVNLVVSGPTQTQSPPPTSQTGKPATTGASGTQMFGASGTPSGTSSKTSSSGHSKAADIAIGITVPIVVILLLIAM